MSIGLRKNLIEYSGHFNIIEGQNLSVATITDAFANDFQSFLHGFMMAMQLRSAHHVDDPENPAGVLSWTPFVQSMRILSQDADKTEEIEPSSVNVLIHVLCVSLDLGDTEPPTLGAKSLEVVVEYAVVSFFAQMNAQNTIRAVNGRSDR